MTNQTKHFIELSDIVAVQLKCGNKDCDTALVIGLEGEENGSLSTLLAANNNVLTICPACQHNWMGQGHSVFDSEIKKFFRQLSEVRKLQPRFGCSMTFEIKTEIKP